MSYEYDDRDYDRAEYEAEMNSEREHQARLAFAEGFDHHAKRGETVEVECCCEKPALLATDTEAVYDDDWGLFYCNAECYEKHGMHNGGGYYEPQEDFGADHGIHVSDPLDRYMD